MYVHERGMNVAFLVGTCKCHLHSFHPGTNSALVLQLLFCGPCWITHPETSGVEYLALTEHRNRRAVQACSCGWSVRHRWMGCWWRPSLMVVYAEMTACSLPGQAKSRLDQRDISWHAHCCYQGCNWSLCTPLIHLTWQDLAVPHHPSCHNIQEMGYM